MRPSRADQDFRDRGLGDAFFGSHPTLAPALDGAFQHAQFARPNPRARFMPLLPAAATAAWVCGPRSLATSAPRGVIAREGFPPRDGRLHIARINLQGETASPGLLPPQ